MQGKGKADHAKDAGAVLPPGAARRVHPREAGFGWTARLPSGVILPVLDLSAGGMRLGLRPGMPIGADAGPARLDVLEADGAVVAAALECEILRVGNEALAVRFAVSRPDLADQHLRFMARAVLAAIRPASGPGHG